MSFESNRNVSICVFILFVESDWGEDLEMKKTVFSSLKKRNFGMLSLKNPQLLPKE